MKKWRQVFAAVLCLSGVLPLFGWDYEGHRMVNQLALASLPPEFPDFVREPASAERIAFLSGEPDRWRNTPDLPLKHANGIDHYCDAEQIPAAGLDFDRISPLRFEFAVQFAAGRAAHPENFPAIDSSRNADRLREWPGFAPWAITEYYGKLKSAFSYLKAYEDLGTPDEVANARANAIYVMGVMGHYVGDLAQPLHTTDHYNGWVGPNPKEFTRWNGFHAWVDGGFIAHAGIRLDALRPLARPAPALGMTRAANGRDPVFNAVIDYLLAQHALVEPLYQMEKDGWLARDDDSIREEARQFFSRQLLTGGQMLASLWVTAWRSAGPDAYLQAQLLKRHAAEAKLEANP